MGQEEVIQYLRKLQQKGDNSFKTIKEIQLSVQSGDVHRIINRLYAWGYLDIDVHYWPLPIVRRYRIKKQYMNETIKQ